MKIRTMVAAASLAVCAALGVAGSAVADSAANGYAVGSPGNPVGQRGPGTDPHPDQHLRQHRQHHRPADPTAGNVCVNS